jgi:hypothetical protein
VTLRVVASQYAFVPTSRLIAQATQWSALRSASSFTEPVSARPDEDQTASLGAPRIGGAREAEETAEFWRQTRKALADHPEAAEPDLQWERTVADGLAD